MTKENFLQGVDNFSNHRYLLWPSLEATKHLKLPVLELGSGHGSTPFIRSYCSDEALDFISYDSDYEWANKMRSIPVYSWNGQTFWEDSFSVCLLDLAPGEFRKTALTKLTKCEIIVIHDSEPIGWNASDYKVRPLFSSFKYVKDYESPKTGAWATALSNTTDVPKFEL